jgi:hypothetical protein
VSALNVYCPAVAEPPLLDPNQFVLTTFVTASSASYAPKVKGLIGIEGFTAGSGGDPNLVKNIPELTVMGDHSDPSSSQAWSALINSLGGDATTVYLPNVGIFGNGHTMAIELNDEQIADLLENWIKQHVQ